MDSFEIKKINAFFNKQFNTKGFMLKVDKNNTDSAEVYFNNEFLGLIYNLLYSKPIPEAHVDGLNIDYASLYWKYHSFRLAA